MVTLRLTHSVPMGTPFREVPCRDEQIVCLCSTLFAESPTQVHFSLDKKIIFTCVKCIVVQVSEGFCAKVLSDLLPSCMDF